MKHKNVFSPHSSRWMENCYTCIRRVLDTRYLATLFLALILGAGNAWGALTAHQPGIYEKSVAQGGYGIGLTTYSGDQYEVYYFSANSKYGTVTNGATKQQYRLMTADGSSEYILFSANSTTAPWQQSCGWIETSFAATGFAKSDYTYGSDKFNEFFQITPNGGNSSYTKTCWIKPKEGDSFTLKVSGYVEFAMLCKDNSDSKYLTVSVDGGANALTKSTTKGRRAVALTTGEHTITVGVVGNSACEIYGFSLKLPPAGHAITYQCNGATSGCPANVAGGATTLPNPLPSGLEKTGHDFGGWFTNEGLTSAATAGAAISANTTLYAKWTPAEYAITLHDNGGTINAGNVTKYTYGVGATLPTNVTKANSDFAGWYADSNFSGSAVTSIATSATGAKEFWAKWNAEAPKHNITYTETRGANMSNYPTQYAEGTGISAFAPLADVEGWHFTGWNPASITASANLDITIEAQWTPIHTVTFNANGGSPVNPQQVIHGATATAPNSDRAGWSLAGWVKEGEVNAYNFATPITDATTFNAKWTRTSAGSDICTTIFEAQATSTSAATASVGTVTLTGMTDGKSTSNATYPYSVKFNSSGNVKMEPASGKEIAVGDKLTVMIYNQNSSAKTTGYKIDGVDVSANIGAKAIHTFENSLTAAQIVNGAVNINRINSDGYFVYAKITHCDPLKAIFMNGETKLHEIAAESGEKLTNLFEDNKLPVLQQTGMNFLGWFTDLENPNSQVGNSSTISAPTTYYAKWQVKTTALTLMANETNGTDGSAIATYGSDELTDYVAATTTNDNIALKGYYTEATNGTLVINQDGSLAAVWASEAEAMTLYAQWGEKLDVTFYNESTEYATQKVAEGGHAVAPATNPVKAGYRFMGWSETANGQVVDLADVTISAPKDFYAIFHKEWTVTFNSNGGTAIAAVKVLDGEAVDAPTAPTRQNWQFDGWNLGNAAYNFSALVSDDIELMAQWTRNANLGGNEITEIIVSDTQAANAVLTAPVYGYDQQYSGPGTYALTGGKTGGDSGKRYIEFTIPAGYTGIAFYDVTTDKSSRYGVIANSAQANNYSPTNNVAYFSAPNYLYTEELPADTYYATSLGGSLTIKNLSVTLTSVPVEVRFADVVYDAINDEYVGDTTTIMAMVGETLGNLFANGALPAGNLAGGGEWLDENGAEVSAETPIAGAMVVTKSYPATAIALNPSAKTIEQGESFAIEAQLTPVYATDVLEWTTTDATVADVADGVVTAVFVTKATETKSATITASIGQISAECAVTVTPSTLQEFALTAYEGTLLELDDNQYLPIRLEGSQEGKTYVLYKDGVAINQSEKEGTGNPLAWTVNATGSYTVKVGAYPVSIEPVVMAAAVDKKLVQVIFTNGFDAFIKDNTVYAYYMDGEEVPAVASYVANTENVVSNVTIADGKLVVTGTDNSVKRYDLVLEPVAPFATVNEEIVFSEDKDWVKNGYGRGDATDKYGYKFSKTDGNWEREKVGNTRIYFFFGPAEKVTFVSGGENRAIEVFVNGVKYQDVTAIPKYNAAENSFIVPLNLHANNFVEIRSNQTNGDGAVKSVRLKGWELIRNNVAGRFGTCCYPNAVDANMYRGGSFWRIADTYGVGIVLEEVTELAAGTPYIFLGEENAVYAVWNEANPAGEAGVANGLVGAFVQTEIPSARQGHNCYIIKENHLFLCGDNCHIGANRAYVNMDAIGATAPVPGRRRIMVGGAAGVATGIDNLSDDSIIDMSGSKKIVLDGVMYIIRDGRLFDATGRALK